MSDKTDETPSDKADAFRFVLKSEQSKALFVFIEPWADEFEVPAGSSVTVTLEGTPPRGAPHAVLEWHEWGVLVWAELGMVKRTVISENGTVLIETSPELARLLTVAEQATFGFPRGPAPSKSRWPRRKRP